MIGDVEHRLAADNLSRNLGAVRQRHGQLLGAGDDVRVGDDVTVLIDDEPGAGADGDELVVVGSSLCWAPSMPSLSAFVDAVRRRLRCPQPGNSPMPGISGNSGKPSIPREAAEIGLADRLQVEDGDDRGVRPAPRRPPRTSRSRPAQTGRRTRCRLRHRPPTARRRWREGCLRAGCRARSRSPRQGQGPAPTPRSSPPCAGGFPSLRPCCCSLALPVGTARPSADTKVTGPGGGMARPAPPPEPIVRMSMARRR